MPNPISSENRSVYGPLSSTDQECDPNTSTCAETRPPAAGSTPSLTAAPVYITGDLDPGARALVRSHGEALAESSCVTERWKARTTCAIATSAAGGTALTAATGVGLLVGLVGTVGAGIQCAADVVAARDCEEQALRRAELDAACTANDGVLLVGATLDLICLRTQ
jgi:hypothetical protein